MKMFGKKTLGKAVRITRIYRRGKPFKTYRDVLTVARAAAESGIKTGDDLDSFQCGRPVKRSRKIGGVRVEVEYLADHRPHGKGTVERIHAGVLRYRPEVVRGGIVL